MSWTPADGARPRRDEAARRAQLAALLAERFGIELESYSPRLVELLLDRLPADLGRSDPTTLETVLAACSIGETTFLRHPEHFELLAALVGELRPQGRPLRVWSAGCASGEEAWSAAAVLRRAGIAELEVLGSDVNPCAIARARDARYRLWSLRGLSRDLLPAWLRVHDLEVEVDPSLREFVRFDVRNLARDDFPTELDVVLCRNVLLYFRPEAAARVYARLAGCVRPQGLLLTGYVDPAPEHPAWRAEERDGVRFYRRARAEAAASTRARPRPLRAADAPSNGPGTPAIEPLLALARGLAAQRAFDAALAALEEAALAAPLAVEPHALAALVADEAGRTDLALAAARRAAFLAPEEPVLEFLVAVCRLRSGARGLGRQGLIRAQARLESFADPAAPLPYGEGLTGAQLRRMIDVQLTCGD